MSPAIAIMQPYLFPYLPYLALIYNSVEFVFYDDVNYIKSGWINRNRIVVNGGVQYFSVPLSQASSFRQIRDIETFKFAQFRRKFLATLSQNYASAPYRERGMEYADLVLSSHVGYVAPLAARSVMAACEILDLRTNFAHSSADYSCSGNVSGTDRVLEIVKNSGKDAYLNPYGGKALYSAQLFRDNGIELRLLDPDVQANVTPTDRDPGKLSVLHDFFMFPLEELKTRIRRYRVIRP